MSICLVCGFKISSSFHYQLMQLDECEHFIHKTCALVLKKDFISCCPCGAEFSVNDKAHILHLDSWNNSHIIKCFHCHSPIDVPDQMFRLDCGHVVHCTCAKLLKTDYGFCYQCGVPLSKKDKSRLKKLLRAGSLLIDAI